jgi:hypothetical protein
MRRVSGCKFERYHISILAAAVFVVIDFHGAHFFSAWMRSKAYKKHCQLSFY